MDECEEGGEGGADGGRGWRLELGLRRGMPIEVSMVGGGAERGR